MTKDPLFSRQLEELHYSIENQLKSDPSSNPNAETLEILLDFIGEVRALQHTVHASIRHGVLHEVDAKLARDKVSPQIYKEEYAHLVNFASEYGDSYQEFCDELKTISGRDTLVIKTPDGQYASIAVGQVADNIRDYIYYVMDEYKHRDDLDILASEPNKTFSELLSIYRDALWKKDVKQYDGILGALIDYIDRAGVEVIACAGKLEVTNPDINAGPLEALKYRNHENSWYNQGAVEAKKAGDAIIRHAKYESDKIGDMFKAADEHNILTESCRNYIKRSIKELQSAVLSRSTGQER